MWVFLYVTYVLFTFLEQGIRVRGPPLLLFQVKKLHFPEALKWIESGSVLRVQLEESEIQTAVRGGTLLSRSLVV